MSGAINLLHLYAFMDRTRTALLFTEENDQYREGKSDTEILETNMRPETLWHFVAVNMRVNFSFYELLVRGTLSFRSFYIKNYN
jgi:hypothetical protein